MLKSYAAALALCLMSAQAAACQPPGNPGSPCADFFSAELLAGAASEVAGLRSEPLGALITFIADCQRDIDMLANHACEAARSRLGIQASKAHKLQSVILSMIPVGKIAKGNTRETVAMIERRGEIFWALSKAASSRYEALAAR